MASMAVSSVASIFAKCLDTGAFSTTGAISNWFTSSPAAQQAMNAFASLAGALNANQMMAVLLVSAASGTAPLSPSGLNMKTLLANINAVAAYVAGNQAAAGNSPINDLVNGPSYVA